MLLSWKEYIYGGGTISERLKEELMKEINLLRRHQASRYSNVSTLILNIVQSFIQLAVDGLGKLDFYKQDFEERFLQSTNTFYDQISAEYLAENSPVEYLLKAEQCLLHEEQFARQYLHENSEFELIRVCKHSLIDKRFPELFKCFPELLEQSRTEGKIYFRIFFEGNQLKTAMYTFYFATRFNAILFIGKTSSFSNQRFR